MDYYRFFKTKIWKFNVVIFNWSPLFVIFALFLLIPFQLTFEYFKYKICINKRKTLCGCGYSIFICYWHEKKKLLHRSNTEHQNKVGMKRVQKEKRKVINCDYNIYDQPTWTSNCIIERILFCLFFFVLFFVKYIFFSISLGFLLLVHWEKYAKWEQNTSRINSKRLNKTAKRIIAIVLFCFCFCFRFTFSWIFFPEKLLVYISWFFCSLPFLSTQMEKKSLQNIEIEFRMKQRDGK